MTSAGLNSLRQKEYQISVKNGIFDDPCHKKGLILVIWVLGMIKPSGSVNFLMKWGCWGHWGCRVFKAWKITTKDFRVIQAWKIILNFSIFSVGGCWGQPMSFFWKLFDETQISTPPEATRNHTSIKLLIPLPLRADLLMSVHSETPCMKVYEQTNRQFALEQN